MKYKRPDLVIFRKMIKEYEMAEKRGRKPNKRVKIEIEIDMSDAGYREMKPTLKAIVEDSFLVFGGTLVYLSVDTIEK